MALLPLQMTCRQMLSAAMAKNTADGGALSSTQIGHPRSLVIHTPLGHHAAWSLVHAAYARRLYYPAPADLDHEDVLAAQRSRALCVHSIPTVTLAVIHATPTVSCVGELDR